MVTSLHILPEVVCAYARVVPSHTNGIIQDLEGEVSQGHLPVPLVVVLIKQGLEK